MKRYLIFSGEYFYPKGGFMDFQESVETFEEAITARDTYVDAGGNNLLNGEPRVWAHVVDTYSWKEVDV